MRISVTILQYEHGIIRQVLDVLAEVIRSERTEACSKEVKEILHFLYEFGDRFHNTKEEGLFFPVVLEEFPDFTEKVESILVEHRLIRALFEDSIHALDDKNWNLLDETGLILVKHMIALVENEENHLFPTIDEFLSFDIDECLNQSYSQFLSRFGEDYHQKAELFANDIQDRLLGPGFFNQGIY